VFEELSRSINLALAKPVPPVDAVIAACDRLAGMLNEETHAPLLMRLGMGRGKALWELAHAKRMMSRPYLEQRVRAEFGAAGIPGRREYVPLGETQTVIEEWRPLGVLLHISAGNADALPAYSVIEGLITGNVNLLKLPEGESGLSAGILEALCAAEPCLADRVHILDVRSRETEKLKALAVLADGIALWGSDEAVRAVRALAEPRTKLIEWGNRLSFAYVSPEAADEFLRGVARDMAFTNQLYCSSAQGIFVDTQEWEDVRRIASRFLPLLEAEARDHPANLDAFARAGLSFGLLADSLEARLSGEWELLRGENCSVAAYPDFALASSRQYANCWVRPLPRGQIIERLRPHAGLLQTVALQCADGVRAQVAHALFAAGAARVTDGFHMSQTYCAMPRDGMLPLSRCMKRVSMARENGV